MFRDNLNPCSPLWPPGITVAQCWTKMAEGHDQLHPCGTVGAASGTGTATGTGVCASTPVCPLTLSPPVLHSHISFICWQLPEILSSHFLSLSSSLSVNLDINHILIFRKCSCVVECTPGPCSVPYILFHETCFISACPPTVPLSSSSQSETSFIGDLILAWNCILSCFINTARYRNCCILNHIYLFTTEEMFYTVKLSRWF